MKKSLLIALLFSAILTSNAQEKKSLKFYPSVGLRLHTDGLETVRSAKTPKMLSSLVMGLNLEKGDFTLSYQKDTWGSLFEHSLYPERVRETREEDQILLYYQPKKIRFAIGWYWKKYENSIGYTFLGGPSYIKGLEFAAAYPFNRLSIEYRAKIALGNDNFSPLSLSQHSIIFLYDFKKKGVEKTQDFIQPNILIGSRFSPTTYELKFAEGRNKVFGIAPTIGVELLFVKYNISLNLEKDWYVYLNGGSVERDVRSIITNSSVGAKYHLELKNSRHFRFGLAWNLVDDSNLYDNLVITNPDINKVINYQVKGIGVSFTYEIFKNTDLEIKTLIPTIGEKLFETADRTSLGLFYRFEP